MAGRAAAKFDHLFGALIRTAFLLVSMFIAGHSLASTVVMVDGASWGFKFEPTSAQTRKSDPATGEFQFEALTQDGFIVTGFVEPAEGKGTNAKTCRTFYWQLFSKNPMIDKATIRVGSTGKQFEVVSYVAKGSTPTQRFVQFNSHYYGFRDGKCIDIHVSQAFSETGEPDFTNLRSFFKSFGYSDAK